MRLSLKIALALAAFFFLTSCRLLTDQTGDRRAELLRLHPVGRTTKSEVRRSFLPVEPEYRFVRPPEGWGILKSPYMIDQVTNAEARSGSMITSFDVYHAPYGPFSLCRCWFYFDAHNRLVDADWRYATD